MTGKPTGTKLIDQKFPDAIFVGRLARETILNKKKELFIDKPGGNLLYSAYGFSIWGKIAGLVSAVSLEYPEEWIDEFDKQSFNTQGIIKRQGTTDLKTFLMVDESLHITETRPEKFFLENNIKIPKSLLGFELEQELIDNRKQGSKFTIRPGDLPEEFFNTRYLALCPIDYLTHNLLPAFFRSRAGGEVFIHASRGYANSSFFYDIPSLINGAHTLLISEENAKRLFLGKTTDLWIIAETLASFGVDTIIISKNMGGFFVFDKQNLKKFYLPVYPSHCVDPVGFDDAFFGGYIAGYLSTFNVVQASINGSVTASIKQEGSSPNYMYGVLPDLMKARADFLFSKVEFIH